MKKFYDKFSKQQWRITVPNLNTGNKLFSKRDSNSDGVRKRTSTAGSYDVQAAQELYDRTTSLPNSVYINSDKSASSSETEEEDDDEQFQDATNDIELYADVMNNIETLKITQNCENNAEFEYDVPKISFKFFEGRKQNPSPVPVAEEEEEEKFVNRTETVFQNPTKLMKSGSDPNIRQHNAADNDNEEEDVFDNDGFYKVPRNLKITNRLSQSLNNFDSDNLQPITINSAHSSIEHVSCSQNMLNMQEKQSMNSENMDYCKVRSKLPMILRRPTFIRKKPKLSMDKFRQIRTKFNNMMSEHAKQQRVGAFNERTIQFDEMYKNSKYKCRQFFTSTTKIFKTSTKSVRPSSTTTTTTTSHRVLTANDIKYKFNNSIDSVNTNHLSLDEKCCLDEEPNIFATSFDSANRKSRCFVEVNDEICIINCC